MSSSRDQNSYQEISFHKQSVETESCHQDNYKKFNTQQSSQEQKLQILTLRMKELEMQLIKQREKSTQLEKRNQQLTDMLVSASQSSVKRNEHFIKEVERKICNFRAVKDLSSSTFRPKREIDEKQQKIRIMTETSQDYNRNFSMTNRQSHHSRIGYHTMTIKILAAVFVSFFVPRFNNRLTMTQIPQPIVKFDSNKENANSINQKFKTQNDKFSKLKYNFYELESNQMKTKEKFALSNFEKQKDHCGKRKNNDAIDDNFNTVNKNTILSPFTKNADIKTFSKLQNKLMRI